MKKFKNLGNASMAFLNCRLLIIYLLVAVSFFACRKEPTARYACDPATQDWVVKNLDHLKNLSRDSILKYSFNRQMAIFRALTPEKKVKLWQEKINIVLAGNQLSESDKTHLRKLINYLQPYHYESDKGRIDFAGYAKRWEEEAKKMGWDSAKVFFNTNTWLTEAEFKALRTKVLEAEKLNPQNNSAVEPSCSCSYDIYCWPNRLCTGDGKCCETPDGCGVFGTSSCDGHCV